MAKIRILIVEDDAIWRKGLVDYLSKEPDLTIAGTAETREEAVQLFQQQVVDIVLLDINLTENNLDGIDLAHQLVDLQADCKIIMLTSLTREEIIVESFSAGVVNYISKLDYKEIPAAVRAAYHQQSAIHPTAAAALRHEFLRLKQEENQKLLSPAEKEILQLIHDGYTQSEIEKRLHIAKRTIKNHINRILKKMGAKTSKEAASIAKQKKML
ncbi:response regulator transcription factor [Brevibacillus humidisoli]|uniref:response regulator n=1 Tax=Brevibacillus humidisoli TaxID=2895522 RepID=UPI001E4D0378|nr:response regulator transcription factor [Brevibacillus humidisoli]UFJ39316.1 response regulator transcription factor [Brevibacillus humidisoli]